MTQTCLQLRVGSIRASSSQLLSDIVSDAVVEEQL